MTPDEFKEWRKRMGFSQAQAARKLDKSIRAIGYYESGERDGRPYRIPRTVELATKAIESGL